MTKTLTRTGNSDALVISKEMRAHLGLTGNRIGVQYLEGRIVLTKAQEFEEALDATVEQFDDALRNLAK
jgi:hypothetical protein